MITFYHLFESIYGLSGSIDKGLTSQGREREEGRGGDENCCDRTTPVFNDRSNSFHYRTRHFGRRIPSRLMPPRPTISRPWNGKKGGEGGGRKKEERKERKEKKNVAAAKGKRWELIKSWSGRGQKFSAGRGLEKFDRPDDVFTSEMPKIKSI